MHVYTCLYTYIKYIYIIYFIPLIPFDTRNAQIINTSPFKLLLYLFCQSSLYCFVLYCSPDSPHSTYYMLHAHFTRMSLQCQQLLEIPLLRSAATVRCECYCFHCTCQVCFYEKCSYEKVKWQIRKCKKSFPSLSLSI